MSRFISLIAGRRTRSTAVRITKWVLGTVAAAQAVAIFTITIIDQIRKLRIPGGHHDFPALAPKPFQAADTEVNIYTDGRALYADMLSQIRAAKKVIYFETFIWKSDESGHAFKEALIEAALRGVQVHVIYDAFGNLVVPPRFKIFPKLPTLHILRFPLLRPGLLALNPRKSGRDHRKILVVDEKVGFVGGYNIGDLYAKEWRDTQVRIRGEAVWELSNAFKDFWNAHRYRYHPLLPDKGQKRWDSRITASLNQPNRLLFPVRGLYIDAFERASERIWITQAYFIPDREILSALIGAARRGVDVKVLVPETSNHVIADWVASAYFQEMLEAGIELWLYEHAMNHSKTATVDGRWTTIGTANVDRLSMTGNFEVNLQFHSSAVARKMEEVFHNDLSTSRQLTLIQWDKRPFIQRGVERLLRPLGFLL